jgi:hypothetical protein
MKRTATVPELLERETALAELEELLSAAIAGGGRTALVSGEAGIDVIERESRRVSGSPSSPPARRPA